MLTSDTEPLPSGHSQYITHLKSGPSTPGPKTCATMAIPGRPQHTYSCNNACGGETEFIKGGDISSG